MEYVRYEVDTAIDAIEARDYAAVVARLAPLAEQGNAKATINLALLYSCGWGPALDAPKAAEMYSRVAERGIRDGVISAVACNNLGTIYRQGRPGIERDDEKAEKYFRLAEELGLQNQRFGGNATSTVVKSEIGGA